MRMLTLRTFRVLGDLWVLEELFDVTISLFSLNPDGTTRVVWTSGSKTTRELLLNIEDNHFSLITDIVTHAKAFTCKTCSRVLTHKHAVTTHTRLTTDATQFKFAGEQFAQFRTIFDKLEDMGLCVVVEKRYYPYRITYDIEAYMDVNGVPEDTPQFSYEALHRFMSISVHSNAPGFYRSKLFCVRGRFKRFLSGRFVDYLLLIAKR